MAAAQQTHPSRAALEAFLNGRLEEREQALVEAHVAQCAACCDVLRRLPHDNLVERLRLVETSAMGETQALPAMQDAGPAETVGRSLRDRQRVSEKPAYDSETGDGEIPPELADHPRYRILEQLGAGGMGVVYRAEHRVMERPVALKVIHHRLVSNPLAVERFHQEVKAAARLAHRNIVTAYDAEQAGGLHFLVMEFVEGTSLADLVKRRGPLAVLHAANYILQAAMGLVHAHEHGMVHRDIKPQNLMRTPKGAIKVLDFGLARFASQQTSDETGLTMAGATVGTPDYIAPEQARDSRRADIRSDIYSLGCTFYFLLTGRPPFPQGTAIEKFIAHSEHEPTPLGELRKDVPLDVLYVVERMMAKDPGQRYQTPSELVEALKPLGKPGATVEQAAAPTIQTQTVGGMPPPLEQLDALAMQPGPLLPSPLWQTPPRRTGDMGRMLKRYRTPLYIAGGALALVLALMWLAPVVRDLVAGGTPAEPPQPIKTAGIVQANRANEPRQADAPRPMGEWFDLLPNVRTEWNKVSGQWRLEGSTLTVDAAPNAAVLFLPHKPPEEYDLEVRFERTGGGHSIAVIFAAPNGQATLEFDCWGQGLSGIQNIGGQSLQQQAEAGRLRLANGSPNTALVKVRRNRVEGYLDGKLVQAHDGDGSDLSLLPIWQLPNPRMIGLGAFQSAATFHSVRLRPVR
jgi:serine/threonine protein kinase